MMIKPNKIEPQKYIMTKYKIEEVDDSSDFLFIFQILLALIFLPIGIIWGLIKLINYFSDRAKENEIKNHDLHNAKYAELQQLATLRQQGLITEDEFQVRRERIMRHL